MKNSSYHQAKFNTVDAAQTESKEHFLNFSPEYQIKVTFLSKAQESLGVLNQPYDWRVNQAYVVLYVLFYLFF